METKIKEFLKAKMPEAKEVSVTDLRKNTEGYSYETYTFQAEWVEKGQKISKKLVIRSEPIEEGLVPPYDVEPQYWVQKALADTPVPVPNVFWLEKDPYVMGKPFYMMDWVEGDVPIPWGFAVNERYKDPEEKKQMGKQLVEIVAHLHMVDWKAKGLDKHLPVPPEGGKEVARRHLEKWENLLEINRVAAEPLMAEALVFLKENMPDTKELSLVHGDYRMGNFIWNKNKGRIAAMLDWELTQIGDPMMDLGWMLEYHWRGGMGDYSKVQTLLPEEQVYEYYEEITGKKIDKDRLRYWRVMEIFKNQVILIIASRVVLDNKSKDLRILAFGVLPYPHNRELSDLLL